MDPEVLKRLVAEGEVHLEFVAKLHRKQYNRGILSSLILKRLVILIRLIRLGQLTQRLEYLAYNEKVSGSNPLLPIARLVELVDTTDLKFVSLRVSVQLR